MSAGMDRGFAGVVVALLPLLGASAQAQAPAVESSHPPFPETEEIVVTAPWGAALVASETELDETRSDAYVENSIGELVSLIAPLNGRAEERPLVSITAQRLGGSTGNHSFPPADFAG